MRLAFYLHGREASEPLKAGSDETTADSKLDDMISEFLGGISDFFQIWVD